MQKLSSTTWDKIYLFAFNKGAIIETSPTSPEGHLSSPKETSQLSVWGDSLRTGSEAWDDGNRLAGDGCNSSWSQVETGFIWFGGSDASRDTCLHWSEGFYPNHLKNSWITQWGDGIVAGDEEWDDGNLRDNDGWNSKWTFEAKSNKFEVLFCIIDLLFI